MAVLEGSGAREVLSRSTDDPIPQAPRLYLAALALMSLIIEYFPASVDQVCMFSSIRDLFLWWRA